MIDALFKANQYAAHHFIYVERRDVHREFARFQPRKIQQIAHQIGKTVRFIQYHAQVCRAIVIADGTVWRLSWVAAGFSLAALLPVLAARGKLDSSR